MSTLVPALNLTPALVLLADLLLGAVPSPARERESDVIKTYPLLRQHGKSSGYIPVTMPGESSTQKNTILHREDLR